MPGEAHILVGCGGSGIKTLRRLNELLSQDYYWRRRLDNDIYYVIVDTDADEMKEFEKSVMRDLTGVHDKPYIVPVQLSKGETHLQPLVNQYFIKPFAGGKKLEGRKRLLEHWWNRGPDAPFMAPKVTAVAEGAGQCPPVSYFLTWKNLKELEDQFRKLIEAIQLRKGGFGRWDVLNFLIVAGLSGGTGRGCWELIAFKMRELFGRYGQPPAPRAFLFDSSVFGDVFELNAEQRTPMRVNSLTGVSQLTCWISNKLVGHEQPKAIVPYRLPSMDKPETPDTDVLRVDLELDVNNAAPVNHAYLVFDNNGVAHLANHFQYCEMVGAGIYAALSKSSILRQAINSNFPYVGLATATYEVNASTIRRYFESQARVQATLMLTRLDQDKVSQCVEAFFKKTQLRVDVTDEDPGSLFRPDPKGLFLQKVLARLDAKSGPKLSGLDKALEDDNVDESKRLVRGALAKNEDLVRSCFKEVMQEEKLDPYAEAVALTKSLFDETKSVENVRVFIEKVQAGLDEEISEMPGEMPLGRDDPAKLVEELSDRAFPLMGRHFNAGERNKIREATRRAIPRVNYPVLRQQLGEAYQQWEKSIDRLRANAVDLTDCLQKLERKFSSERERAVPGHENAFAQLFSDPAEPEKGLEERFAAKRFYRRELKPPLAKGDDLQLLQGQFEMAKELFVVAFDALVQERKFSETEAFDVRKRLQNRVEPAIQQSVGLQDQFISEHFSIRRVIRNLIRAWKARLQQKMRQDQRDHLEERFEESFGFIPKRADDGGELAYDFPEPDDFVLHMAASLGRTCKPYWMLNRDKGVDFKVALFVPTQLDREAARTKVEEFLDDRSILVEVYPELQAAGPTSTTTANPFIMLAYSTQGVQNISDVASLGYYTESEVFDLLKQCEDSSGKTIFEGALNGGLGYVDPLYVKNESIRQLRWRPWVGDVSVREQEDTQILEALLYALFPGDEKDLSALLSDLRKKLSALGWEMPLFKNTGGNRYVFARLPMEQVDGKVRVDHQTQKVPGWNTDRPVATIAGVHHLYAVMCSGNEGSKPEWRERILQESKTFWDGILTDPTINLSRGTPTFNSMLGEYTKWLGERSRKGKKDDPNRKVWEKLLAHVAKLTGS